MILHASLSLCAISPSADPPNGSMMGDFNRKKFLQTPKWTHSAFELWLPSRFSGWVKMSYSRWLGSPYWYLTTREPSRLAWWVWYVILWLAPLLSLFYISPQKNPLYFQLGGTSNLPMILQPILINGISGTPNIKILSGDKWCFQYEVSNNATALDSHTNAFMRQGWLLEG